MNFVCLLISLWVNLNKFPSIFEHLKCMRSNYNQCAFDRCVFQIFDAHSEETKKKVVPVIGVMDAENMGFDDETLAELRENVNIIFHVAATIKFNTHLRVAIQTNLTGTLRCIEFGKSLRSLAAFIHLSTAFCNSNQKGLLEEKVYPPAQDPYEMLKMADNDEAWVNIKTRADWLHLTKDHPNTYTFTKQLAENLVMKELAGYPAAIVRPSIGKSLCVCIRDRLIGNNLAKLKVK